jgi:glyoxylase-like metal-dependent hydrolase (beta-lactamase superfamily II)
MTVAAVAPGVHALLRQEPPGLLNDATSVLIVNDADVVVVDTQLTVASAQASLAALRSITPKPASHIVNTNWHDRHVVGNGVYAAAFPAAVLVGHARLAEESLSAGAAVRRQMQAGIPALLAELRLAVEQRKSLRGGAITDEERASYESDLARSGAVAADSASAPALAPTVTVTDRLTLTRGRRRIELVHLGRAFTTTDLVVWLPAERIAITGDLLSAPVPVIGSGSHPADWADALDRLLALKPSAIVPGRGPVMTTDAYARDVQRLLRTLAADVKAQVAQGATLAAVRRAVTLSEFRPLFAKGSPLVEYLFGFSVVQPGVTAAYRDATAAGQPIPAGSRVTGGSQK